MSPLAYDRPELPEDPFPSMTLQIPDKWHVTVWEKITVMHRNVRRAMSARRRKCVSIRGSKTVLLFLAAV